MVAAGGGIDLETAVAAVGPLDRVEVACIATVVALHLHDLHGAGLTDGRIDADRVLLESGGPTVVPLAEPTDGATPEADVRAWADVVHLAALGRRAERALPVDPEVVAGLDLSVADLVVSATRTNPEDRPGIETVLKVLLGGRIGTDPSVLVDGLLDRTWRLRPELERLAAGEAPTEASASGGSLPVALLAGIALAAVAVVALVVLLLT